MKKVVIEVMELDGSYDVLVRGPASEFSTYVLEGGTLEEALAAVGEAVPIPEEKAHEPH